MSEPSPTEIDLCHPGDEPDATGVETMLREAGVDCVVVPFGDTAYPGIVDRERPWGVIRVASEELPRAKELLADWRGAEFEDIEQAWQRPPADAPAAAPDPQRGNGLWILLVLVLCIIGMAAATQLVLR